MIKINKQKKLVKNANDSVSQTGNMCEARQGYMRENGVNYCSCRISALSKHISNLTLKIHTHTCMPNSACRSGSQLAQIEVVMKSNINIQVCSMFPIYSRFKKFLENPIKIVKKSSHKEETWSLGK